MIVAEKLTRTFRVYRKDPGILAGLRGLFYREYHEVRAVDEVSFRIEEGEFVGFLGPNGAGKTTVLKMLAGLIHPSAGSCTVLGFIPRERFNEYRRQFALVLGQKNQLWWDLPAQDSFTLLRHIYEVPKAAFAERLEELSQLLQVKEKLRVMVRELSLGERMKMELIAALLHRPRVLFLDEPTIGLDVVSQRTVRRFLRDYNRRHRTTILLTSHYMADIQELCERVIVINQGRKLYDGPLARLESGRGLSKIIRFRPSGEWPADWDAPGRRLAAEPPAIALLVPPDQVVAASQRILATGPVDDISIEDVPLEDVIHDLFSSLDTAAADARVNHSTS